MIDHTLFDLPAAEKATRAALSIRSLVFLLQQNRLSAEQRDEPLFSDHIQEGLEWAIHLIAEGLPAHIAKAAMQGEIP